ncbi:MAG: carbon monoxide dehydrogenase subunit G [Saprospiraceae bacterium]|jgi:carbon monoxide dehydrogenase subunit G
MNLSYEAIQGMLEMMAKATNEMTVVSNSQNKSKIVVNMEWKVRGPLEEKMSNMMNDNLTTLIDVFLNDIKVFAETGKVSEAKQKRIDELNEK